MPALSWYDLPSFLPPLFPPLSVPHPISITFQLHLTSSACLPPPPLQLQGVLVQLCYICTRTSLRLTSDLLGPDPHAKGTVYILPIICLILSSLSIMGNCLLV